MTFHGLLSGRKTHILTGLTIVGAVALYLVGEISLEQAIAMVVGGGYASTFRAAMQSASNRQSHEAVKVARFLAMQIGKKDDG